MSERFAIVDNKEVDTESFPNSGVKHAKITEAIGAEDMRVNVLFLAPGDVVGYHAHERQEEIYVCTRGPGQVYIDGDLHEVPEGGMVRVSADVPRQLLNTTESADHQWILFGAPPTGTVEGLGEYVRAKGGYGSETG